MLPVGFFEPSLRIYLRIVRASVGAVTRYHFEIVCQSDIFQLSFDLTNWEMSQPDSYKYAQDSRQRNDGVSDPSLILTKPTFVCICLR